MKGTLLYQCRFCSYDLIPIKKVVEHVECPMCRHENKLIPSSVQYLKWFFEENGVADSCQNTHQTAPVATGYMGRKKIEMDKR